MPTAEDLDPVSGYLTVADGVDTAMITIRVTDDNEEESNEVFAVKLISAKGGARVIDNGGATAIMTGKVHDVLRIHGRGIISIYLMR